MALNSLALNGALINVTGQAQGLAQQLQLTNAPTRVQFLKQQGTVMAFDAVINMSHAYSSQPTMFPLEDGSVISDHLIQQPMKLGITGILSDTPLPSTVASYMTQTFGVAAASLLPPLGVTMASTGYALYQQLDEALDGNVKRTKDAFDALVSLYRGAPDAIPPRPPEPFTVMTKYGRFASMVITDLEFPADPSTDGQLVANISLVHMNVVTPQVVKLSTLSNSVLAAAKVQAGGQDDDLADYINSQIKAGDTSGKRAIQFVSGQ